jgi:hypothetical protein
VARHLARTVSTGLSVLATQIVPTLFNPSISVIYSLFRDGGNKTDTGGDFSK